MTDNDCIKEIMIRDNWEQAHRIDEKRIIVLHKLEGLTLPYVIHYFDIELGLYDGGVYTNDKTRAFKHYLYALEGYLEDEQRHIEHLKDIIQGILVQVESSKISRKRKTALKPELERALTELKKAKANLEAMAINLVV